MLTARYTHGFKKDQVAAVNALPDLSPPTDEAQNTTGTDDVSSERLALCVAQMGGFDKTLTDLNGHNEPCSAESVSHGAATRKPIESRPCDTPGGVAEWLNAPVLKTGVDLVFTVGSNPTPTA